MRVFQTDIRTMAVNLLPTVLRQAALIGFLRCLVLPVSTLQDKLLVYRNDTNFWLTHNGQVCHLKNVLNKYFHKTYADGFEIEDIVTPGLWLMVYDEIETFENQHVIVEDEQTFLLVIDETPTGGSDVITEDEPSGVMLGGDEAKALLWDEQTILMYTSTFIVFCPADVFAVEDYMRQVRTLVNKYRLVSRLPIYRLKNE